MDERNLDLDAAPLPVLEELLESDEPGLRADAACALGDRLRTKELNEVTTELREKLAKLLNDKDFMVRLESAITLAELQDHRATPTLLASMRHRAVRLDAIRALGTMGDRAAVEELRTLARRWYYPWADRLQAAAALCALGDPDGAAYLEGKLKSRRRAERSAAIHFVGEARHPQALSILSALLADPRERMRDVAARALGWLGDPAAVAALERAKPTADPELLEDIDDALVRLR